MIRQINIVNLSIIGILALSLKGIWWHLLNSTLLSVSTYYLWDRQTDHLTGHVLTVLSFSGPLLAYYTHLNIITWICVNAAVWNISPDRNNHNGLKTLAIQTYGWFLSNVSTIEGPDFISWILSTLATTEMLVGLIQIQMNKTKYTKQTIAHTTDVIALAGWVCSAYLFRKDCIFLSIVLALSSHLGTLACTNL